MTPKQKTNQILAQNIIDKFKSRGIQGYYCNTSSEAVELVKTLIEGNDTIAWGGSETLKEIGLFEMLNNGNYTLLDRSTAKTDLEKREMYAKHVMSDVFLMSSNAVTMNGELINIDGNGNRVACLITGPKSVIVIAGMNKVTASLESALERVRNIAAPPNAKRLNLETPCSNKGRCFDCLSDSCICCNTVVTRKSREQGRIKVILVNENLGY